MSRLAIKCCTALRLSSMNHQKAACGELAQKLHSLRTLHVSPHPPGPSARSGVVQCSPMGLELDVSTSRSIQETLGHCRECIDHFWILVRGFAHSRRDVYFRDLEQPRSAQAELNAVLADKRGELDRLSFYFESLEKVEREQKAIIDRLRENDA